MSVIDARPKNDLVRTYHRLVVHAVVVVLAMGCNESTRPNKDPIPGSTTTFVASTSLAGPGAQRLVYVALPTGAMPDGEHAVLRVVRTDARVGVPVIEGGFDPVPIVAAKGDSISVTVSLSGSSESRVVTFAVPNPARPIVIRTSPPKNKRDVPPTAAMIVVFSEPVDESTLTSASVQLRRNGIAVPGRLMFSDDTHITVVFIPDLPLAANTDYELYVSEGVRDLSGETLPSAVSVPFTTKVSAVPAESRLVFLVQPGTTQVGYSFNPELQIGIVDAEGRIDESSSAYVTMTLAPHISGASVNGVHGSAAVRGVARFNAQSITGSGTGLVIVASSSGLGSVSSNPFTVTLPPCPGCPTAGVIAFVRGGNIHALNLQESVEARLTTGGNYSAPVWSPDGRRLAFTSSRYNPLDIYVMVDDENRLVRRMVTNGGFWGTVAWSPDGQRILYLGVWGSTFRMSVMNAETGAISPLPLYGNALGQYPSWSPDGTRIAFESDYSTWNVAWDIYVATVDGSSITLLTHGQYYPYYPAWSPDGASIAFVRGFSLNMYGTRYNLAVMNADGTNVRELAWVGDHTKGAPGSITWSPDGSTIAFTAVDCDLTLQTSCSNTPSIKYVTLDGSRGGLIMANGADPSWKR